MPRCQVLPGNAQSEAEPRLGGSASQRPLSARDWERTNAHPQYFLRASAAQVQPIQAVLRIHNRITTGEYHA